MSSELRFEHCPECNNIFQRNLHNMCVECYRKLDAQIQNIERVLMRNRRMTNEQLSEAAAIPIVTLNRWIRSGRLKLFDYPNLHDQCDTCAKPIRRGTLCSDCTIKLKNEIAHELEQERLFKERSRKSTYMVRGNS